MIDILKFDVELAEWGAIDTMLTDGSLSSVKQLVFEVHPVKDDIKHYIYFTRIINGLLNAGFERWYFVSIGQHYSGFKIGTRNYYPQTNLYFINTRFMKI